MRIIENLLGAPTISHIDADSEADRDVDTDVAVSGGPIVRSRSSKSTGEMKND